MVPEARLRENIESFFVAGLRQITKSFLLQMKKANAVPLDIIRRSCLLRHPKIQLPAFSSPVPHSTKSPASSFTRMAEIASYEHPCDQ